MRFLTAKQIRDYEGRVLSGLSSSLKLIDNAAANCVRELEGFGAICVFCGKGNNGADGYRAAELLKERGAEVKIVSVFEPKTEECRINAEKCRKAGIEIIPFNCLESADFPVILDAVFGIGVSGEVTGEAKAAIEYINASGSYVVSVDVPSGLDCERGTACGVCVRADKTVAFTAPKIGMLSNESVDLCGEIAVCDAGIPVNWAEIPSSQPAPLVLQTVRPLLPRRSRLSHKGTFGRLVMLAGSRGMMGAAIMAAKAAQRSGCGLVYIVCEKGLESILNIAVPEAVAVPVEEYSLSDSALRQALERADALLIGCGSGKSLTADFIASVLDFVRCPAVIDADGLNALSGRTEILKGRNAVITPHPLEFSRLTGTDVNHIENSRLSAAADFAQNYGIALVLKGARTIVAEKSGEFSVSLTATSALAKGGSGDVLSGVISALCAQGISPADSAKLGVYLHGRSGQICAKRCGEYSTTIDDIIQNLKYVFAEVLSNE